jgi:hypothetical protein
MREKLISYLLGELDVEEHERLHAELQRSPELRAELARLRACLLENREEDVPVEPPGDLAQRVTQQIICALPLHDPSELHRADILARLAEPPAGVLGWSLADLTVAGGVILAVSMLLFPALRSSRDGTRLNVCQDNLVALYVLGTGYADRHHGLLPQGEPNEPAGSYVAELVDAGVREEVLRPRLTCPAAPAVEQIRANQQLPGMKRFRNMTPDEANRIARWMSPSYAIRVGYYAGGKYHPARLVRHRNYPLIADSPGDENGHMSPNHDGYVIQVVFGDGSVRTLTSSMVPGLSDHLFRNDHGQVGAGCGPHDCVLSRSEARPASNIFVLGTPDEISDGLR